MFSRPFLNREKLNILLDSRSLNNSLTSNNTAAKIILKYLVCEPFAFIRSPFRTNFPELIAVPSIIPNYNENGELTTFDIVSDKWKSNTAFGYKQRNIVELGKLIYKKPDISSEEKEAILLVCFQAALNWKNEMRILTTNDEILLNNRTWFETHFPGGILNIASFEETKEIMDLIAKRRNQYFISANYLINKSWWYKYSFASKIPNYYDITRDGIMNAFAIRFEYLLMCIDELGFQYYSGVNNDTMASMLYHFNYFISLVTGIFDALAIKTQKQLEIQFKGDNIPSRISLNPTAGRDFLKVLQEKSGDLHKHVIIHNNFIKLIYLLRELILHREMLDTIRDSTEKRSLNLVMVEQEIKNLIKQCSDNSQDYEPISIWGLKQEFFGKYLLEPYHFAKAATGLLIHFCNDYLRQLNSRQTSKNPINEQKELKLFVEDHLGF